MTIGGFPEPIPSLAVLCCAVQHHYCHRQKVLIRRKPTPLLFIVLSKMPEIMAENKTLKHVNIQKVYLVNITHRNRVCRHIPELGGVP